MTKLPWHVADAAVAAIAGVQAAGVVCSAINKWHFMLLPSCVCDGRPVSTSSQPILACGGATQWTARVQQTAICGYRFVARLVMQLLQKQLLRQQVHMCPMCLRSC
jgi:hypothetical protein